MNKELKNINPNTPFGILSDEEIGLVLVHRARELRLSKRIKQKILVKMQDLVLLALTEILNKKVQFHF